MKPIGKILLAPLMLLTIAVALFLPLCGYSGYLFTPKFPELSLLGMIFPFALIADSCLILLWLLIHRKAALIPLAAILVSLPPTLDYCPLHAFKALSGRDGVTQAGGDGGADDAGGASEAGRTGKAVDAGKAGRTGKAADAGKAVDSGDAADAGDVQGASVRIMSYNIKQLGITENNDRSASNPGLKYLASCDADIVCIQEGYTTVMKDYELKSGLTERFKYRKYLDGNGNNSILSRYPIIRFQEIDIPESSTGSIVHALIIIGPDSISVYNCHLESFKLDQSNIDGYLGLISNPKDESNYGESFKILDKLSSAAVARARQADLLDSLLTADPFEHIIVCGDFNDTPLSYAHNKVARHLKDAHTRSGFGPGISYYWNRMYFRIDQTFMSRSLTPTSCRIDRTVKISDHYPLVTDFHL